MSKKDPQFMNVAHIAKTNRENNHYYFDEATVKYLQSKYYQHVFHYCYFISSEIYPHDAPVSVGEELYTIRRADEEGSVTSVGPLGRFKTLKEALHNVEEIIKDDKKNRGVE
jgi:hypothetical protein|tara:strand:- start:1389 stop:1724 length:336 start_codon:yes stop_codon:yes gene_type:complete